MRIAVISDLHIGPGARPQDLRVPGDRGSDFVLRFREFVGNQGLTCKYLFLPGDLTESARPDEMEAASQLVCDIAEALGVERDHVVFAPGNHDKDWTPLKADGKDHSGFRKEQAYHPLASDRWLFGEVLSERDTNFTQDPFFSCWVYPDLFVLAFNSAWDDWPAAGKRRVVPSHGSIDPVQIKAIEELLDGVPYRADQPRVLMVHHHPVQHSKPDPGPDFSQMQNADLLLDLLGQHRFDLVVHGHKHFPRFRHHQTDCGRTLSVFCAGSFTKDLKKSLTWRVNNQFHVLDVDGRDDSTHLLVGRVRSWKYHGFQGWLPSDPDAGIHHENHFGRPVDPFVLSAEILEPLRARLLQHRVAEWRDLCDLAPSAEFVTPETRDILLSTLRDQLADMSVELKLDGLGSLLYLRPSVG